VLHCTLGDVLIASVAFLGSVAVFGRSGWPIRRFPLVAVSTVMSALAYTVFSEWLNTVVRESWAYRDAMPRLPWLGTGLTPVLQWIVVPGVAFWWAAAGRSSAD
jgi:hypothetical protein